MKLEEIPQTKLDSIKTLEEPDWLMSEIEEAIENATTWPEAQVDIANRLLDIRNVLNKVMNVIAGQNVGYHV